MFQQALRTAVRRGPRPAAPLPRTPAHPTPWGLRPFATCPPKPPLQPDIDFQELSQRCETKELFIVDVRTPEEVNSLGMVPNSVHVDIRSFGHMFLLPEEEFQVVVGAAKPAADQEIVTVCKKGIRARTTQLSLMGLGYTNVRRYKGSFDDWLAQGGRIVPKGE